MKKTKRYLKMISIVLLLSGFALLTTGCPNSNHDGLIQMVRVQGGTFERGRELGPGVYDSGNTTPVYEITVSDFYMGRFPVTQGEWYDVMGTRPSHFDGTMDWRGNPVSGVNWRNLPMEQVSWYDAIVFANRLSIREGLTPAYEMQTEANPNNWSYNPDTWGTIPTSSDARWNNVRVVTGSAGYRLPTEAQWEFAAKGGVVCQGNYTFSGGNDVEEVAWIWANSGGRTHEVGTRKANALEIYDMSGNVWEWVWDWHGTYTSTPATDPFGASEGSSRVVRGGSWGGAALLARSVDRRGFNPNGRWADIGFRLVRP